MMTEQDLAIEEMQGWIKDQVDELKNQVELTEAEVETLSEGGNSKKKKKGKSATIAKSKIYRNKLTT